MLTRAHRFHGYGSLRRTYSNGQTARGSLISLRYASRPPGKPYRVAVVVSRKVHKSAVVRNRIRRRIYEYVRQSESVPQTTDLIFTVFSDKVASLEAKQLDTIMSELLTKANLQLKKTA
jgi:ribonuclease P protein component